MTRGGRTKDRSDPERRCIVTGETHPKRGLVRFVLSPEGVVTADLMEKLPGRGLWVAAERSALEAAVKQPEAPVRLLELLEALYFETGGDEVGLQLFDEWSSKGEKYPGFEEISYKYESFSNHTGSSITIAMWRALARRSFLRSPVRTISTGPVN